MRLIQAAMALVAVLLVSVPVASPAAAATTTYLLSMVCGVDMRVVVDSKELGSCVATAMDGSRPVAVPAGASVRLVATAPVAKWTGCTVAPASPPYACELTMTGNKTVTNTAPPKAATPTASPGQSTTSGHHNS